MARFAATLLLTGIVGLGGCDGAGSPPAEPALRLAGTVTYRERMALPPGTTVEVRLEDVSLADAPAVVIAEQSLTMGDRQVPVAFELSYDAGRIEPRRSYGIRASILGADGALLFTTTEFHPAFADGQPVEPLEVLVQRVASQVPDAAAPPAAGGAIAAGPWRLTSIRRPDGSIADVTGDATYTIAFGADGRYTGLAHCNRYTGGYAQPEPGKLTMTGGATTLMACPEPSLAGEFLKSLGQATGYEVAGDTLRLQFGEGGQLTFARDGSSPQARAGSPPAQPAPEVGRSFAYDCDGGLSFTVRTGPGELASFEIGGRRFVDCRSNPARVPWADAARRGAIFRAIGNEPAWNVEIHRDRFVIVTDLGARRIETPYTAAVGSGSSTIWRGVGAMPAVRVDRTPCADTMSGEVFEASATATLENGILYGCGRFL